LNWICLINLFFPFEIWYWVTKFKEEKNKTKFHLSEFPPYFYIKIILCAKKEDSYLSSDQVMWGWNPIWSHGPLFWQMKPYGALYSPPFICYPFWSMGQ